jgi:hypothetical protein
MGKFGRQRELPHIAAASQDNYLIKSMYYRVGCIPIRNNAAIRCLFRMALGHNPQQ